MSGLSEALRLAFKLKRPAAELLQTATELTARFRKLNQLVSTTRAPGPAKSAVALSARVSQTFTANHPAMGRRRRRLLAASEVVVTRS